MRCLLDEDTPHSIRDQLLRRIPDLEVIAVGDEAAPAYGTSDPNILRWIERERYALVSRNRRTMPQHLRQHLEAGGHVPGVLLLRRGYTLREIIDDLRLIWESGDPEEFRDQLVYLPL